MRRPDPSSNAGPTPVLLVLSPHLLDVLIAACVTWQRARKVDGLTFDPELGDVVTMLAGVRRRPEMTSVDEPLPAAHAEPMLLRYPEAAARLAISERHLQRLISQGRLRRVRLGASARVHRDDLDTYMSAVRQETP